MTLKNALTSYGDVAESETYALAAVVVRAGRAANVRPAGLLPALAAKKLKQIDPWDANQKVR